MKKYILLILLLVSLQLVFAYPQCKDDWYEDTTCQDIVNLARNCNTYDIYYSNFSLYSNNNMTLLNGTYYSYNLNISDVGTYVIQFCDVVTWATMNVQYVAPVSYNFEIKAITYTSPAWKNYKTTITAYVNNTREAVNSVNGSIYKPDGSFDNISLVKQSELNNVSVWNASYTFFLTGNYIFYINASDSIEKKTASLTIPVTESTNTGSGGGGGGSGGNIITGYGILNEENLSKRIVIATDKTFYKKGDNVSVSIKTYYNQTLTDFYVVGLRVSYNNVILLENTANRETKGVYNYKFTLNDIDSGKLEITALGSDKSEKFTDTKVIEVRETRPFLSIYNDQGNIDGVYLTLAIIFVILIIALIAMFLSRKKKEG
jgi:hypothetical protein